MKSPRAALVLLAAALLAFAILTPELAGAGDLSGIVHVYTGANAAWLNGPDVADPGDVEAGGSASASLSPHITLVAGSFYGFTHQYVRWDGGVRITATDVNNPNFDVYLGARYRGGSKAEVQPNEWAPDAGFGWRPSPARFHNITLGADAGYGLQSKGVLSYLWARYQLPLK